MAAAPHLDLSLRLLQQWRMVHALAEGSQRFTIPVAQEENLAHLKRFFAVPLEVGNGPPAPRALLRLNTAEPWSEVAGLRRTLVYPHGMLERCRALWQDERPFRFGFAGMEHRGRGNTLDAWRAAAFTEPDEPIRLRRGQDLSLVTEPRNVAVVYSKIGRAFPFKVWDDAYYRFLGGCAFTLCPNGEEVWTYRFFEAMLCGSLPVVESDCPVYHGFRYRFLSDTDGTVEVDPADLLHNLEACRERLTVPRDELDANVPRYLG
jgi:hypothetical protein